MLFTYKEFYETHLDIYKFIYVLSVIIRPMLGDGGAV